MPPAITSSPPIGGEAEPSRLGDVTTLKVVLALMLVGTHGLSHLHAIPASRTHLLPAVPVFMFLSGYFMLANYKRSPDPRRFLARRYIKLLPIMVMCLIATLALLLIYGGWPMAPSVTAALPTFILTQLTVFQRYVPASFQTLGAPIENGSLWFLEAIVVLYATLPIVAFLERWIKGLLVMLCGISVAMSIGWTAYAVHAGGLGATAEAAMGATVEDALSPQAIYIIKLCLRTASAAWMFYAGCLIRRHQDWFFKPGVGAMLVASSLAATFVLYATGLGQWNHFGVTPPWFYLGYITIWIAIHKRVLEQRSAPPISISLFVWHIPAFHGMSYLGLGTLWLAGPATVLIAWTSLYVIERPLTRLLATKQPRQHATTNNSLRPIDMG